MTETSTQARPPKQKLSTAQMLHLMRLESQQALRHGHPLSCIVCGIDGFDEPEDGAQRKALMPLLFRELKAATFELGLRGLGVFTDRFQLAVFPQLVPGRIQELAEALLRRARGMTERPTTLSIGISHNQHKEETSFETLVREAEMGMGLARGAGGDRFLLARDVESEVDQLRRELESEIEEVRSFESRYLSEQDGLEESWGRSLIEKTLLLFEREPDRSEGVLRLQREVIALITREVAQWRDSSSARQMIESHKQIDMLERRIQKLTQSLGVTEEELRRVAAMKNIDLGLASIYRTVQGLSSEDQLAEQKREMLKDIFEANIQLLDELAAKSA